MEGALAHAGAVVSTDDIVNGLAPSDRLRGCQNGRLHLLVDVLGLLFVAVFVLNCVVRSVLSLVIHLEDSVEAARVGLRRHDLVVDGSSGLRFLEVVIVGVPLAQLFLQLFDAPLDSIFCLSCLFLLAIN